MRRMAAIVLFFATLSLALGVSLPLLSIERLWLFTDRPSLAQIVASLWNGGEPLLALIVGMFSLVLPGLKLLLLWLAAVEGGGAHTPVWLKAMAGWSMLDVLVAALVIVMAKTGTLADASTLPGLWFFAFSVLMTAIAAALLEKSNRPSGPG